MSKKPNLNNWRKRVMSQRDLHKIHPSAHHVNEHDAAHQEKPGDGQKKSIPTTERLS